MIDIVRNAFITNTLPGGGSFMMTPELPEQKSLNCKVYPNPALSKVHLVFDLPVKEQATLRIIDFQGRTIQLQYLRAGTTEAVLDVSGLSQGLYLIVIQSTHGMTTKKLSVTR